MYTVLHNDSDSCPHNQTSYKIGITPIVVGILSDVAACVGSLAIILLYIAWKDLRRGAQSIITWLAIADLCTAISYILGDVAVLHYDETQGHDCDSLCDIFCRITTYFVFCSITASFLWNAILAFHFYLILVCKSTRLDLATPLYHVIAWGLPVLIGLIFLSTETFPYAPFVSGVVCFSENPVTAYSTDMNIGAKVALKIPEFVGYFFMLILYIASVTIMCRKVSLPIVHELGHLLTCIHLMHLMHYLDACAINWLCICFLQAKVKVKKSTTKFFKSTEWVSLQCIGGFT